MSERDPHDEERFEVGRKDRRSGRRSGKSASRSVLEFVVILAVSFGLVFGVVRPYVVEAFYIPSASMVPTLMVGDRVLVNKFLYRFEKPHRGDIIVFRSVEGTNDDLIKRVVGVPGDVIRVKDGRLFVNGEPQNEPYTNKAMPDTSFFGPETVPKNSVFVMGDNRADSEDSRYFGPVPDKNIEGEAFLVFWPVSHIRSLL